MLFYHLLIFSLSTCKKKFFQKYYTIKVSNILNPDPADILSGLIYCVAGKELINARVKAFNGKHANLHCQSTQQLNLPVECKVCP